LFSRPALRATAATVVAGFLASSPAVAQGGISLIRDAEIERTIQSYATPLFAAAGLDPGSVQVYLVNDRRLNAFVAGGQRLFLNTGLIARAQTPNQLIGVIAHETGHIAGGHLARLQDALGQASVTAIVATLLGLAAAAAAGDGRAAGAAILGGLQVAERTLLKYNRVQESAADQAALTYLDRTGQSAAGMRQFFDHLADQELLAAIRQDPYMRTHPLTRERMDAVEAHIARSPHSAARDPPALQARHDRMIAKIKGFLEPPGKTLATYPESDRSIPARYARAVAYYRIPDLKRALVAVDELIAEAPDDPYFLELKGQILFENGRLAEALVPYRKAHQIAPYEPLIALSLAQVMVEANDPAQLGEARGLLTGILRREPRNPTVWRLLAIVHGRDGDIGQAALALAEYGSARGDWKSARQQADRAMQILPRGSEAWLRAEDLKREGDRERERERERNRR